ncbi:hypothetical protein BDM02DRAFT_152734 [Thelephora ganbajun]|uniref:Uncharacterized protein n=1 Tax=Thelephora ganbajun TaxID=370292 RepID=A0ACB6ZYC1_THEGA|nr:hypothetical protein BDM02DRAFT_152734 [Thelephora ganbajun]
MTSIQGGVDSKPIRMYEATPKAVASNIVFLAAWLAGTTGYFLSILATTFARCIQWFPFLRPESNSPPSASVPVRTFNRTPRPKPIMTRPSLSRENVERHVTFSLNARTSRDILPPLQPSTENMTCTTASFSSGDSTLCSSPLSDPGDLPPLKNLPLLSLDPQMPEQIQVKKRSMTANFPIKARNPFKFRRASTPAAPSPTPEIGEILPVCPSIDRPPASPVELGPGKPSLIRRLSMKGRRAYNVNTVTESPSSAPTSPRLSPSSFRNAANTSRRSASVDIPAQTSDCPAFAPPSPHQSPPRRTLFGGFTKRPRTVSPSQAPARTQPYGPPYNCPFPVPQPRRSSGTRRSTTSTQTSIPVN